MAKYRARPVEVDAFQITHVSPHMLGEHTITLDNGTSMDLSRGQTNGGVHTGDYLIISTAGGDSTYVCPRDIFLAKYDLVGAPAETPVSSMGLISARRALYNPTTGAAEGVSEIAPDDNVNVILPAEQPPVDNDHVEEGATPFSEEEIASNTDEVPTLKKKKASAK